MKERNPNEHRYDLGVLLVHGIGQQGQGDTLVRFGEPVQRWLQRWISKKSGPGTEDRALIMDARVTPAVTDIEAPAHAVLHVIAKTDKGGDHATWLLAESWWANAFLPPNFSDLATWGFQILPWTLSTHFATRARRVVQDLSAALGFQRGAVAVRLGLEILGFLLAVLLFPLLATLLIVVLIVGVLPIPRVRAFAARLQRILSSTLGDSFVLIASPIQEAVIVGKVERDLRWLVGQGCRRVAIIAHSRGAAIAHAAIKKLGSAKCETRADSRSDPADKLLFVTVGSGLNKLAEVRRIRSTPSLASVWTAPLGLLVLAFALPEVYTSFQTDKENYFAMYVAVFGLALFMWGIFAAWKENRPKPEELAFGSEIRWIDFYASADPVPNGRMFDSEEVTRRVMDARKVYNLSSPLVDHVIYWRNDDEFLSQLVCALGEHGHLQLCEDNSLDRSHLTVAVHRRRWRVRWLVFVRLLIAALTAGVAIRYWAELPAITQESLNALASMVNWIPIVGDLLKPIAQIEVASQLVGAGALVVFGLTAYYALYGTWMIWNRTDIAAFFERKPFEALGASFLGFLLLFVGVVETFALVIAGYGAGLFPGLIAAAMFWVAVLFAGSMIFVLIGLFGGALHQLWPVAREMWREVGGLIRKMLVADKIREAAPTKPMSENAFAGRLIDWPERRFDRQLCISFFVLILLSFPYQSFVAAPMASEDLWVERWYWGPGLFNAIEHQSSNFAIPLWQWLLGAFVLVMSINVVSAFGGFRWLHRRFVHAAHAGPIAIAHANQLPKQEAIEVLKQGASFLKKDYATLESRLEKLRVAELRAEDGKAEVDCSAVNGESYKIASGSDLEKHCAQRLRALAREAWEFAARLPENDPDARDLLERVARTNPEAALTLAERISRSDPEAAARYLRLHADQTSWLLRIRIRRALARLGWPTGEQRLRL